jgi:hypothetical protein
VIGAENLVVVGAGLFVQLQRSGDLARTAAGGEVALGRDRAEVAGAQHALPVGHCFLVEAMASFGRRPKHAG